MSTWEVVAQVSDPPGWGAGPVLLAPLWTGVGSQPGPRRTGLHTGPSWRVAHLSSLRATLKGACLHFPTRSDMPVPMPPARCPVPGWGKDGQAGLPGVWGCLVGLLLPGQAGSFGSCHRLCPDQPLCLLTYPGLGYRCWAPCGCQEVPGSPPQGGPCRGGTQVQLSSTVPQTFHLRWMGTGARVAVRAVPPS